MQAFIEVYNFIYNNGFFLKDSVSLLFAYYLVHYLREAFWNLGLHHPDRYKIHFQHSFCLHKVRSTAEKMKFSIKDLSSN